MGVNRRPRRFASLVVSAAVTALLVVGCTAAPGSGSIVGTLSTTSPRLCVAGPTGNGDCFRWASPTRVLDQAQIGDCVEVSTRPGRRSQLATGIRSVDPRDWPQACPLPLAPKPVSGVSHCGALYNIDINGRDGDPSMRLEAGACGGHLNTGPLMPVWLHHGDRLVVELNSAGPFPKGLSAPRSSNRRILRPVRSSSRAAVWVVGREGRAQLAVATPFCGSYRSPATPGPDKWQTCPVVSVLVASRG
jgi:hypothetical protein